MKNNLWRRGSLRPPLGVVWREGGSFWADEKKIPADATKIRPMKKKYLPVKIKFPADDKTFSGGGGP